LSAANTHVLAQPHASAAAFVLNDKFTTGGLKGPLDSPDGILAKLLTTLKTSNGVRGYLGGQSQITHARGMCRARHPAPHRQ